MKTYDILRVVILPVEMVLEECRGRWRVVLDRDVVGFFEERGLKQELEEWRRSLEEDLNKDPSVVLRLLREPLLGRAGPLKARRYKLYLRGKGYRLVFVVNTRQYVAVSLM